MSHYQKTSFSQFPSEHFQYPRAVSLYCRRPLGAAVTAGTEVFSSSTLELANCERAKLLPRGANLVTDQSFVIKGNDGARTKRGIIQNNYSTCWGPRCLCCGKWLHVMPSCRGWLFGCCGSKQSLWINSTEHNKPKE